MHLLLIGSGGREHALAWKLASSESITRVSVAPGNAGIAREPGVDCIPINAADITALADFAQRESVHLTIVGPEAPLVEGIVDYFAETGLKIFGPHRQAAQLEGSKAFAKKFMSDHGIPTAAYHSFSDAESALTWIATASAPLVIKADGLAAGKGVVVAQSIEEAQRATRAMFDGQFGAAGSTVVIEEFLPGEEASFIAVVSGRDCIALASSQDHKARDEGDVGPNTGGMGAYSPAPVLTDSINQQVMDMIVNPTINAFADSGRPFVGFLYVGLMIDSVGQARVVEYNVRLGDPETQPLMLRLKSDLFELLEHAVNGTLAEANVHWHDGSAIGVVLAGADYPNSSSQGELITGISDAERFNCKVFHAGTRFEDGRLLTSGGRVLCVTARGATLREAKSRADQGAACIQWTGVHYRRDIGHRAISREG